MDFKYNRNTHQRSTGDVVANTNSKLYPETSIFPTLIYLFKLKARRRNHRFMLTRNMDKYPKRKQVAC
jgi:hypothetical protein